jgi:signal transduction histidine kinase
MLNGEFAYKTKEDLQKELEDLRCQLEEANETIEAIRTGQIDALLVQGENGHQIYTLKSADHSYRIFIEKMTEGAVTLNAKGVILYCNSQFATMVRLPLSKVIGMQFDLFVAPENKLLYEDLFDQCWSTDCKGEVLLVAGEGFTPVQLSFATLELEEGISLSIILTDLTAQKNTQKELRGNYKKLEETNKALETSNHDLQQFASVASHDLQEPLRKILIFSSLLKDRQADLAPEFRKYLEKIMKSSKRMKSLIIDILNYSRLSANDTPMEYVDLDELVKELKEDFELLIEDKQAELIVDPLPVLYANKGQIRQVFQNIISNALKFSMPGKPPVIRVTSKRVAEKSFSSEARADGDFCLISIRDNGIGFDQQYVNNIFALFERLNSKDKYEGTGIGLALAKKIIEKHKGIITGRSKEGEGAEFSFVLPVDQSRL